MPFSNLKEKLGSISNKARSVDVSFFLDKAIMETSEMLTELVKKQLYSGEKGDGRMRKYKREKYAKQKASMNPSAGGVADLFVTGNFYKSIFTEVIGDNIVTDSNWDGAKDLEFGTDIMEAFTSEIYKLNEENKEVYRIILVERVKKLMIDAFR